MGFFRKSGVFDNQYQLLVGLKGARSEERMGDKPLDGMLKVTVVQGRKLAVRDFTSSDPYVILKLGNQTAKTKVINCSLNPLWNEEFTFNITDHLGVLNLEVFDKDRFKSDDKMGHAYVNLQAIETSSRLRHVLQASAGETRLRKMVPSDENCLMRESFVRCVDGEIVQDVWLKLLDVESGDLELKIRWIDRT
ncbi:Protein C2-DOMAIN ABA-RELATED 11 [Asimina triloba]